ncbi:uncharacterized protein LOC116195848 isoform X2 [Punica granatum]|uniref:Uncharacterized protein LOC116195848 isoform X2 n=1 Tax=Punica granatum TaxID=22663 RepID=A0A6P8CB82_PUNGR|nr:uncharacterized protein LOC116195848 isoform X2 [Punica granatum]
MLTSKSSPALPKVPFHQTHPLFTLTPARSPETTAGLFIASARVYLQWVFLNQQFRVLSGSELRNKGQELIMVRKKDPFWHYVEPAAEGRFKCKYCGRDFAGGIPRVKSHLSGIKGRDIDICLKVPEDVQVAAREAINGVKRKQKAEASSDDAQISALDATNGTNKRPKVEACSAIIYQAVRS